MRKMRKSEGGTIGRMPSEKSSPRRVSRQREAGEATRQETRRKLLVAAREEFAESGYKASTVSLIADRADVSVQTLYHSWGSKRDLLRGVLAEAVTGREETPIESGQVPRTILAAMDPAEGDDPRRLLAHMVHEFRLLAERAATIWRTYRDAAAVDPDIEAEWRGLMELRRSEFRRLLSNIPDSAWRSGLTHESAADIAWAIASPQLHESLVDYAGYSYDELEAWLLDVLGAALLE
jgi:AcrR family transcriptional regulator